jgi:hypothetical protein
VKQLWLSLLRDLGFRGILDLPPEQELENYSTGDIVDQVKRVVVGPAAWLEGFDHGASSQSRTMLHRRLCFDSVPDAQDLIDFHLLPGGRYMVIRTRVALHVSDFASGLRIWSYAARLDETRWAVDLLPGGTILHVLVLTTYYLAPDTPYVQNTSTIRQLICGFRTDIFLCMKSTLPLLNAAKYSVIVRVRWGGMDGGPASLETFWCSGSLVVLRIRFF